MADKPLSNPFDFSNPVRSPEALAGRKRELDEALYYLGQESGATSYSIALIGDRASGKTSLLNALTEQGRNEDLLCAQVALDESVMESELSFFREVFEALLDEGANHGMFGGPAGTQYLRFVDQVELLNTEPAPGEEPLAFGRLYAVAKSEGKNLTPSRVRLRNDFGVLIEEAERVGKQGVVVLIDECDLLGQNKGLLQALRNLLMELSGLKLVLAGTEAMFPAIEDVFSPVPRQFVRINVGNFETWRDTRDAIGTRLKGAGLEWAAPRPQVANDVHRVTRGNPYEVMLLSHFAFRHTVRREGRERLNLTADALEDVARQLEAQDPDLQAAVRKVRALSRSEAAVLWRALALDGVDLRAFGLAETAFADPLDEDRIALAADRAAKHLDRLADTQLVRIEEGRVHVEAAAFERLYIRYSVLGVAGEEVGFPELSNPLGRLAELSGELLRSSFAQRLDVSDHELVLEETRPGAVRTGDFKLAASNLVTDRYSTRVEIPIDVGGREWSTTLWIPDFAESEGTEAVVAALLSELNDRTNVYAVRFGAARLVAIDKEALERVQAALARENDPSVHAISEANVAFWGDESELTKLVENACQTVLEHGFSEEAQEAAPRYLSDLAFMAFGTLGAGTYDQLLKLIKGDHQNSALTLTTQALRLAGLGEYDAALGKLSDARSAVRPELDDFADVIMYSPQMLVRGDPAPILRDAMRNVPLDEVFDVYEAAILAARAGEDVGEVLAEPSDLPEWSRRLGGDADATT